MEQPGFYGAILTLTEIVSNHLRNKSTVSPPTEDLFWVNYYLTVIIVPTAN